MTLDDLQEMATQGRIIELNVLSHEGDIYLVEAVSDERRDILKKHDGDKQPRTFRSFEEARNALCDLPLETVNLVHKNVYDEIGPSGEGSAQGAPAMSLTLPLRP
jgi:hypothetical protein